MMLLGVDGSGKMQGRFFYNVVRGLALAQLDKMEIHPLPSKNLELWSYLRKIALVFAFIALVGVLYFATFPGLHSIYANVVYLKTEGSVISCQSKIHRTTIVPQSGPNVSGYSKSYQMHYQYIVGGHHYRKEGPHSLDSELELNSAPAVFCNSGERIAVYYNPINPTYSRLTNNLLLGHLVLSAVAIFGLLQLIWLLKRKN